MVVKKTFLKIFAIIFFVGALNILLRVYVYDKFTPYYWGNSSITQKRNYLVKQKDSVDVLFIGSSKVLNQISPVVFDSVLNSNGVKSRSFNFGAQAMLVPESFYLLNGVLNNDHFKPHYIVFELTWPKFIDADNLHAHRSSYWLNLNSAIFSNQVILTSHNSLGIKAWNLTSKSINLIEKYYNINFFEEYAQFACNVNDSTMLSEYNLLNNKGFEPLGFPKRKFDKAAFKDLEESRSGSEKNFAPDAYKTGYSPNKYYLKKINDLIAQTEKQGVHIIFIMPTLWKTYQYKEMVPIFNKIDVNHKMVIGDFHKYPQLFSLPNMFNASHLNSTGALVYSKIIADEFMKLRRKRTSKIVKNY